MLEVKNLCYRYFRGERVLKSISISFPREHILALLGESGSGKTTLLKCIGRFLKAESGRISLDGRDIQSFKEEEFRSSIGIVFQDLYLFPHLTVLENLTLALRLVRKVDKREADSRAMAILEKLNIGLIHGNFPAQISGGQAQRAAIARALALRPEYLLLDEPTSALDTKTSDEFGRWLLDLKEETTFIIVTHDVLFCEKIASAGAFIERGKIVASGSIADILKAKS